MHMLTGAPIAILFPVINTRFVSEFFVWFSYFLCVNLFVQEGLLLRMYLGPEKAPTPHRDIK